MINRTIFVFHTFSPIIEKHVFALTPFRFRFRSLSRLLPLFPLHIPSPHPLPSSLAPSPPQKGPSGLAAAPNEGFSFSSPIRLDRGWQVAISRPFLPPAAGAASTRRGWSSHLQWVSRAHVPRHPRRTSLAVAVPRRIASDRYVLKSFSVDFVPFAPFLLFAPFVPFAPFVLFAPFGFRRGGGRPTRRVNPNPRSMILRDGRNPYGRIPHGKRRREGRARDGLT